jgi:plasmid stabilization system protein ParE
MYKLEYLPIARQDMIDIAQYISRELLNPLAAEKLAKEMIESADKLRDFPYANRVYNPIRPLEYEYRRLIVENYLMFYYIDEESKTITIARVIYAGRDYERLL